MNRFVSASADDLQELKKNVHAKNTVRSTMTVARILSEYIAEKNLPYHFPSLSKADMNVFLGKFYAEIRQQNGETYKASSMENMRQGINRYLSSPPYERAVNVIKDPEFHDANVIYRAVLKQLKSDGKGATEHYPVISEGHLRVIYGSKYLDTSTPFGLQNKVQFDIRLYFFRRGAENMHARDKSTFGVRDDGNGSRYVCRLIDEMTKNHRENDKEESSGMMPEMPGNALCPVASFLKYVSKLHPENDKLWQRCRDSFVPDDKVWYQNSCVGTKKLGSFMTDLRKALTLPVDYSNHSIRATGATLLSRASFNPAQIMAVTGHKSVSSLAVYQRVSDQEKLCMGRTISSVVTSTQDEVNLDLEDWDMDDIAHLLPSQSCSERAPSASSTSRHRPISLFSNCEIKKVTINVMK